MNPSYFRINIDLESAIKRLETWNRNSFAVRVESKYLDAVGNCIDGNGRWKGKCLFAYENDGWSVFEDLTGAYSCISASKWIEFAKADKFVLAGYNDAIPYGEMIVIENGFILKDLFDDPTGEDNLSHNVGDGHKNICDWCEIASFVDDDEIIYSDTGVILY